MKSKCTVDEKYRSLHHKKTNNVKRKKYFELNLGI